LSGGQEIFAALIQPDMEEDDTMGKAKINIWVSGEADACGVWAGEGEITVFDCKGVLEWPCGRFLSPEGEWRPVPHGLYKDLPFKCGHLEVEVPPGCYWVIAGYVSQPRPPIHLNYTTHVGIVQACCDETACVKLYNPTIRLCWDWFWAGLRVLNAVGERKIDREKLAQLESIAKELFEGVPQLPIEAAIESIFEDLVKTATKRGRKPTKA